MAIEKFHAEITFPRGEMERILRLAWREGCTNSGKSVNEEPIMVYLLETRRKVSVYMTGYPITAGFAFMLQLFGAKVKRVTKKRSLRDMLKNYVS